MLRRRFIRFALLTALILLAGITSEVQSQELPPILNFSTEQYNGGNQNWSISQASNKKIYVANNDGLLEFNGAKWRLYPSPNSTIMRSVKVINDTIYTGNYMDFGYWTPQANGLLKYTSLPLTKEIDILEDEQIWNIIHQGKWILFQSLNRILIYNIETDQVRYITAGNTINKIFQVGDQIYFQVLKEGLFTIMEGDKKLYSDDPILKDGVVINMFETREGTSFITQNNGLYLLTGAVPSLWNIPANDDIKGLTIYSARQSTNGNLLLGTISDGIHVLNNAGVPLYKLNQGNGLGNNTALSLFEDVDRNIWVGLDNGIDCVNAIAPYANYADEKGRLGTTYASILYNGYQYLGTNQGLFYKAKGSDSEFQLVSGTSGQVWTLNALNGNLFCGHNSGTFVINGGESELISDVMGTWLLREVPGKPNLIVQGNYEGLFVLEKSNGRWTMRNKISGFDLSAKHFEISSDGKILVSHEYKGVFMLKIDQDLTKVISFSKSDAVSKSLNSSIAKFNDTIYYACEEGIFKYIEKSATFVRDPELSKIYEQDEYLTGVLVSHSEDQLWLFTKNYINRVNKESLGDAYSINRIPIPNLLHIGNKGYENIAMIERNEYLVGTSNGYIILNSEDQETSSNIIQLDLVKNGVDVTELSAIDLFEQGDFAARENFMEFHYSVPAYNKFEVTKYQYNLDGRMGDRWSEWSTASSQSFENLKHGDYTFSVRALVGNRETENIASYSFTIQKPYYLSRTAIFLYIIGFFLLAVLVNWLYKRYYRMQQDRAIENSMREMELNELAAQKEIIQLKNESLQQDIDSRNRELAISTMSMIKKNNTLNGIKNELLKLKDTAGVKSVVRLINKTLNDAEDWKFFEQAFNHADQDFFKKIKELHPDLTPGDLRLCSYLRLNLSSKEIAPLLNISPRSVEIKRYRLRKKINLEREINLNDYFINL